MDQLKKPKSGFTKRKEQEKRKLENVAKDPSQAKLGKFFITTTTTTPSTASTSQVETIDTQDETKNKSTPKPIVIDQDESVMDVEPFYEESDEIDNANVELKNNEPLSSVSTNVVQGGPQPIVSEFENDKGLYEEEGHALNEGKIRALLLAGPCQPKEGDMPDGKFKQSTDKRHFNSSLYFINNKKPFMNQSRSPWLSYSVTQNYAYCHFCWLFGDEVVRKSSWYTGFTDWKHFSRSVMQHSLSKVHLNNAVAVSIFLKKEDIRHQVNQQISNAAKKWRTILNVLLDTVKTLSALGVAFRGHRENMQKDDYPGIYLSIIKLISRHNPILQEHIESSERIKYLSKTITLELLNTLAKETRKAIVNECKAAKFFTLIADSTTDVAHLDQMAILLRYVVIQDKDSNSPKICIKESFLCFVQLKKGDATTICNEITAILFDKYDLQKQYLCGQGYDGAAVMSGIHGGVQAQMKEYVGDGSFLPYVHCAGHQMNLVLMHAADNNASPSIKVFFASIQSTFKYFSQSHRRWDAILEESKNPSRNSNSFGIQLLTELRKEIFETNVETNEHKDQVNEEFISSKRVLHIKGLSTTRWAARLKAVEAIIQNFECIIDCIENEILRTGASGEDIMAARSLLSSMNWVFFLNLLWWHSVLSVINTVQVQLQKKELDLITAQRCILTALANLKELRNESTYNNFVLKAKNKWEEMGWENADFPIIRQRKIKKMFDEKAADSRLEIHEKHRASYYEVLDTMCNELQERAEGFGEINDVFGFLMPEKLNNLGEKSENDDLEISVVTLIKKYSEFFTTDLKYELISFANMYFTENRNFSNDSPFHYLEYIIENNVMDSFPECCTLFRLFLTLPVSSASAERVMSSLKIVKEYRRASLSEDTLNDYCILYIERSVTNLLNLDSAMEVFAEQKARRGFTVK